MSDQESHKDRSAPVPDLVSFEDLVAVVDEELQAQVAIGRLGEMETPAHAIYQVAMLIADAVYSGIPLGAARLPRLIVAPGDLLRARVTLPHA